LLLLAGLKLHQKALPLADCSQWWWTAQKQAQPTFLNHKIHKGRSAFAVCMTLLVAAVLTAKAHIGSWHHGSQNWLDSVLPSTTLQNIPPSSHRACFHCPVCVLANLTKAALECQKAQPIQSLICLKDSL